MTKPEQVDPELLGELQSFLRILSRELARRANNVLDIQSGAYSSVMVSGRTPTPSDMDEVLSSLSEKVGEAAFTVLVQQILVEQPTSDFSRLEQELKARRATR